MLMSNIKVKTLKVYSAVAENTVKMLIIHIVNLEFHLKQRKPQFTMGESSSAAEQKSGLTVRHVHATV